MTYTRWMTTDHCVVAVGGESKYHHYVPMRDFRLIGHKVASMLGTMGLVSKPQLERELEGVMLESGKPFSKAGHEYKVTVTLYVLERLGALEIHHPGHGRNPTIISGRIDPARIRKAVDKIFSESIYVKK